MLHRDHRIPWPVRVDKTPDNESPLLRDAPCRGKEFQDSNCKPIKVALLRLYRHRDYQEEIKFEGCVCLQGKNSDRSVPADEGAIFSYGSWKLAHGVARSKDPYAFQIKPLWEILGRWGQDPLLPRHPKILFQNFHVQAILWHRRPRFKLGWGWKKARKGLWAWRFGQIWHFSRPFEF